MKILLWCFALALIMCSCKKFMYHPNEVRPSEKNLNAVNIAKLQASSNKGNFKFILTGDTQRFYDELDDFVNQVNSESDISFVIFDGDLVDFGLNREYEWIASKFNRLNIPYISILGNHDMLANGTLIFRKMFGPENFTFTYNGTKFVCLNTNSRENGFDHTVPDMSWLQNEMKDTVSQNIFVVSHVPPFSVDFDKDLETIYAKTLSSNPRTRASLNAHEHHYKMEQPYNDGLTYVVTGSGNLRDYILVSVSGEDVTIEQKFY